MCGDRQVLKLIKLMDTGLLLYIILVAKHDIFLHERMQPDTIQKMVLFPECVTKLRARAMISMYNK
jgi:hypothetical protein